LRTRAAFGRFVAFEVGWMMWFTRAASWGAVINVLATSLGFYFPALTAGWPRATLITVIIGVIAAINIRGIRQSSTVLNLFTIGKMLPLVAFIVAGIIFIDPSRLVPGAAPPLAQLSATGLLLIFAFGGYEVIPVPAGEAKDPRRAVPFALVMTILIVTLVMTLVQVVALVRCPARDLDDAVADAAAVFLGRAVRS
jgi:amino acid transporter